VVSDEKGSPDWFECGKKNPQGDGIDLATTKRVKWVARLSKSRDCVGWLESRSSRSHRLVSANAIQILLAAQQQVVAYDRR
jgi:hypothetical protein